MTIKIPNFLSTQHLTREEIFQLLEKAQAFLSPEGALLQPPALLKNKTLANLFFENSTRTRSSFEIAATKLGAHVLNFYPSSSSTQKGETVLDTVKNLQAMGVDIFVIRHGDQGMPAWIAEQTHAPVINAGDGSNEHPTQAMLDILTISRHKPDFSKLTISIVGDIKHSRVAHSLCFALNTLGVAEIRLVAPCALLPEARSLPAKCRFHNNLITGIENADVVVMLRVQQERLNKAETNFDLQDYIQCYQLNTENLKHAKPDAIVMHPGPINRGVEMTSEVADGPQSVILEQAKLGVAMRMAILNLFF